MEEKFLKIKDWPYEVSNYGRVRNIRGHIMKIQNIARYKGLTLRKKGERKTFLLHRLVAQYHIPNPNNLPQVNHIDGDKTNNHISNLEWTTSSENHKHGYSIGLKSKKGEKHHLNKLNEKQVLEIRNHEGFYKDIAEKFGISKSQVGSIKRRESWSHL